MPKPRYAQVSLEATPYYHCVSRCVRRAFLCGTDQTSGNSYEHRRQWLEDKLLELASIFALDICAYAIMSNHYHVVFHIDREKAENWSHSEVIEQWHQLFSGTLFSQRFARGEELSPVQQRLLNKHVEEWRLRIMDISWFMRILNETIARKANAEDNCTGRFWEGRFKSQALLDEPALAACMTYVDLNPIRTGIAKTPETSTHTSIQKRLEKAQKTAQPNHPQQQENQLLIFAGNPREDMPKGLPFRLTDYLELVDWTGRILREDKRGAIPENMPPILGRLNIETKHWLYLSKNFESPFKGMVGSVEKLKQVCKNLGYVRTPGINGCKQYLPS
ncbi:MAG: transposase [Ectothiorhodospiraceae bacterium]|nr:transposase [Ectothiorhodospiraceae bacterium]